MWRWLVCIGSFVVIGSAVLAEQRIEPAPRRAAATLIAPSRAVRQRPPVARPTNAAVSQQAAAPAMVPAPRHAPPDLIVTAPAAGLVEAVYARVGDRVSAGQLLMTFNDRTARDVSPQLRFELAAARMHAEELQASIKDIDRSIAAAQAQLATTPVDPEMPPEASAAVARAQSAYNEAVAREQRAEALEAHGLQATQELEASQMGVRQAAADLTFAREQADAKTALARAQATNARTQVATVIAAAQQRRLQAAQDLAATEDKRRAAEAALAAAQTSDRDLTLRAPVGGVITQLMVAPGDRAVAGAALVHVTPD